MSDSETKIESDIVFCALYKTICAGSRITSEASARIYVRFE